MSQKVGVLRFLGTNCDRDVFDALKSCGLDPQWVWYQNQFEWQDFRALVLPGGFSYGDYLRSGALAAKAPVVQSLTEAARHGVPILGICNGFQILCEVGLLPGALVRNQSLRFVDDWFEIQRVGQSSAFVGTRTQSLNLPVAHGEGRYYLEPEGVEELFAKEQVWWTYTNNPNGSVQDIAGVISPSGNVAGLMPHPERAMHDWMGGSSGRLFFETLL